ncbi:GL21085 [Drosophila persimilis]|uniref:GL21085 n=1 Tax=Drosophila persimilis TaxID=7234 RepID=B4GX09_DROPE|nr:GL21085 [Drosophila persimilis]
MVKNDAADTANLSGTMDGGAKDADKGVLVGAATWDRHCNSEWDKSGAEDADKGVLVALVGCAASWERRNGEWDKSGAEDAVKCRQCRGGCPHGYAFSEDVPWEDAPNEDAPWEDAPNKDAPWEDAPWEDAPSEDAPAPTSSLISFCAFPPTVNTGKPKMPMGCRPIQAHTPSFAPSSVFGAIMAAPSSNHYSAVSEVNQPFATNTAAVILREVGATAVLKRVGRPEPLTPNLRRIAINTIADYFVMKKIPLSISKSRNLDRELLSLFPGDQESNYKVSDRSRMYVRYNNRKRLEKHHANVRRKLIWTPTTNEPFSPKTSVASWSQTLPVEFDDVPDNME